MSRKLAIDFGTTNTVLAQWDEATDSARIIDLDGLSSRPVNGQPPLVPSLVYVTDGQWNQVVVGQAVRDNQLDQQNDNRLFRNFKRGVVTLPAPEPRPIDGMVWGDREAGQTFLRHLLDALPYTHENITQLVLTAPVSSFEGYLTWLSDVTSDLSAEQVYIVDESTAAALGYAVTEPGAVVLVFDFGGGTLDLSLVQLPEAREKAGGVLGRLLRGSANQHKARVLAKTGRVIGGSDIDQWLLADVLARVGLTPADLGDEYASLLTLCEQAKIALSLQEETPLTFTAGGQTHTLVITRMELEILLESNGFYRALWVALDKVMHIAHRRGIFREDIHDVLMVGGVSLMPAVQDTLKRYFTRTDVQTTVRADKPFTAVAEGALQLAAGFGLDDYLGQSYGLRHLDPETGEQRYDEIIPMGTAYPLEKPVEVLLGTAHPGQQALEFVIGEIGGERDSLVEVQYEDGQTVFVAQADLNQSEQTIIPLNLTEAQTTLARLDRPVETGQAAIRALFTVDAQRRLRLTATDLNTRQSLLHEVVIATLVKQEDSPVSAASVLTGYEPHLACEKRKRGQRRLSLRGMANALNILPPEAITPAAAEAALRSESFNARYNAANALQKRGDREARLVMQRVLTDGSAPSRATVARHLSGFSWYAAEPLIQQAIQDEDSRVREAVMYALAALNQTSAYQLMAEVLQSEADNVREAAVYGLRDCQHPAAVPVLTMALRADDPEVRSKALEALSVNDTPEALTVVRTALNDRDPLVVYAAVASLLEMAKAECLPEVAALIQQTDGILRRNILLAFFHATNYLNIDVANDPIADTLIDALETALLDANPKTRWAVIWPLAWIRHTRMPDLLKRAYCVEADSFVKAHIVQVAAGLMSAAGEEILQDALHSPDESVQAAAQRILAEREQTGVVLTYDETATAGIGLSKPSRGR